LFEEHFDESITDKQILKAVKEANEYRSHIKGDKHSGKLGAWPQFRDVEP